MVVTPVQTVEFELALEDYRALLRHLCSPGWQRVAGTLPWVVGATFLMSMGVGFFRGDSKTFVAGLVGGLLLGLIITRHMQSGLRPQPGGALLCRYVVQLTEDAGHIQTPNWSCDLPWRAIIAVDETPTHCFLRLDAVTAYTIPKSAFRDEEEVQQFTDFARACVTRAHG